MSKSPIEIAAGIINNAWDDNYYGYDADILNQEIASAIQAERTKLEVAVKVLEEAAQFADTDDVNGFAGDIAREALSKLKEQV